MSVVVAGMGYMGDWSGTAKVMVSSARFRTEGSTPSAPSKNRIIKTICFA